MTTTQHPSLGTTFALFFFPLLAAVVLFGFGHDWYARGRPDLALLLFVVVPITAFGAAYLYRWVAILQPAVPQAPVLAEIDGLKARVAQLEARLENVGKTSA